MAYSSWTPPPQLSESTPCTLADALAQVAVIAAPGSSCPPAALASLQRAEQALGGRFFLVRCGEFDGHHPLAGRPAFGLLQMVLVAVRLDTTGASQYRVRNVPQAIHALQQPEDMADPMVYFVVHELGADGWPTGGGVGGGGASTPQPWQQVAVTPANIFITQCSPLYGRVRSCRVL